MPQLQDFIVGDIWKARDGRKMKIVHLFDEHHDFPVISVDVNGSLAERHTGSGHFFQSEKPYSLDLIEKHVEPRSGFTEITDHGVTIARVKWTEGQFDE